MVAEGQIRNTLHIPFAEWLERMSEAGLPYQARALAIYAAVFKVSSNDELARLSGMKGSTYDKYKKQLLSNGWVIVSRRKGGRGIGVEVSPAYRETPVTFTDVSPKIPGKFYPRNEEVHTGANSAEEAEIAGVIPATTAELAGVSYQTPAEVAPVAKKNYPAPAEREREINNNISSLSPPPVVVTPAKERGTGDVVVSKTGIEGPEFKLDFGAIDLAAKLTPGMSVERARLLAEMCARDWAANGIIPKSAMAMFKAALRSDSNQGQIQDIRLSRANADAQRPTARPGQAGPGVRVDTVQRSVPYWWTTSKHIKHLPVEHWRKAIREFANGMWPIDMLGPVPGTEGCLIPNELVAEMRLTEVYTIEGVKRI